MLKWKGTEVETLQSTKATKAATKLQKQLHVYQNRRGGHGHRQRDITPQSGLLMI